MFTQEDGRDKLERLKNTFNGKQEASYRSIGWLVTDNEQCRGSGRSYLLAVLYIEEAINNPGKVVHLIDHNIFGFYIAVDNAEFICMLQGGGNLARDMQRFFVTHRPFAHDFLGDGHAVDEFHGKKVKTVGVPDVVNANNVWVVEFPGCTRLAFEAFDKGLVPCELRWQHFKRDNAVH